MHLTLMQKGKNSLPANGLETIRESGEGRGTRGNCFLLTFAAQQVLCGLTRIISKNRAVATIKPISLFLEETGSRNADHLQSCRDPVVTLFFTLFSLPHRVGMIKMQLPGQIPTQIIMFYLPETPLKFQMNAAFFTSCPTRPQSNGVLLNS